MLVPEGSVCQNTKPRHWNLRGEREREGGRERERGACILVYKGPWKFGDGEAVKCFSLEWFLVFWMDLMRDTKLRNKTCCVHHTTGQAQCTRIQTILPQETTTPQHSSNMASSSPIMFIFVAFLFAVSSLSPVLSHPIPSDSGHHRPTANQTFHPGLQLQKLKRVRAYLRKINKPAVKTIQAISCL